VAHVRTEELSFSADRAQLSREFLAGGLVATSYNDSVAFRAKASAAARPIPLTRR